MFRFENGVRVRDVISGFEGVITGRADYITGCNQMLVNPQKVADGKIVAGEWIDEHRLAEIPGADRLVVGAGAAPGAMERPPIR